MARMRSSGVSDPKTPSDDDSEGAEMDSSSSGAGGTVCGGAGETCRGDVNCSGEEVNDGTGECTGLCPRSGDGDRLRVRSGLTWSSVPLEGSPVSDSSVSLVGTDGGCMSLSSWSPEAVRRSWRIVGILGSPVLRDVSNRRSSAVEAASQCCVAPSRPLLTRLAPRLWFVWCLGC